MIKWEKAFDIVSHNVENINQIDLENNTVV